MAAAVEVELPSPRLKKLLVNSFGGAGRAPKKEWNNSVEVGFIKYYCYFTKIDLNIDLHLPGNPGT